MERNIKVCVLFEGDSQSGGAYYQQLSTIDELIKQNNCEIVITVLDKNAEHFFSDKAVKVYYLKLNYYDKILRLFNRSEFFRSLNFKSPFENKLKKQKFDLIYFLSPSELALSLTKLNFIFTLWDICHLEYQEFTEVYENRIFEKREILYKAALRKAIAVITESEIGKKNISKYYLVDKKKIYVNHFLSPIKEKFKSNNIFQEGNYIFYPAQFWSHKNHKVIVDAIKILREENIILNAVFVGSDKGNLGFLKNYSESLNLESLIHFLGFVNDDELYSLYKNSLALVMPSYFGPTNIPPIEAFDIGTPVLYSRHLKYKTVSSAFFFDNQNPNSLVKSLKYLLKNKNLNVEIIKNEKNSLTNNSNFSQNIKEIITQFQIKKSCGA